MHWMFAHKIKPTVRCTGLTWLWANLALMAAMILMTVWPNLETKPEPLRLKSPTAAVLLKTAPIEVSGNFG